MLPWNLVATSPLVSSPVNSLMAEMFLFMLCIFAETKCTVWLWQAQHNLPTKWSPIFGKCHASFVRSELCDSPTEKLFNYRALCLKGSELWNSATKSCNSCKYFLPQRSKEYAEILGSSMQGYSYLSSPTSPTVSLVSKAFWIKFSALVYGNPSSPPNAILPGVFLSEPQPLKTKHSEITAGLF